MTTSPRQREEVDVQLDLPKIVWEPGTKGLSGLDYQDTELLREIATSFPDDAYDDRATKFEEDEVQRTVHTFHKCLTLLNDERLVQCVLRLISDCIMEDKTRIRYFYENTDPMALSCPLLDECFRIRSRQYNDGSRMKEAGAYTQAKAREVAAMLLNIPGHSPDRYQEFWMWIVADIDRKAAARSGKNLGLERGILALKLALYSHEFQEHFVNSKSALETLWNVLKTQTEAGGGKNRQVIYLTVFCLWILSFNDDAVLDVRSKSERQMYEYLAHVGILKTIINLVKSRLNPKIVRICLQFFANLLGKGRFNEVFVNGGLVDTVLALKDEAQSPYPASGDNADPEIADSIDKLLQGLAKDVKELSSFEKYAQELESGMLAWGPVHTEPFWKSNVHKFEQEDFAPVKDLVRLLQDSSAPETIAIACYDLGEFGRFYPEGRRIVHKLGGKEQIMLRLQEDHATKEYEQVRKHALLSVQKLLVANWEAIS